MPLKKKPKKELQRCVVIPGGRKEGRHIFLFSRMRRPPPATSPKPPHSVLAEKLRGNVADRKFVENSNDRQHAYEQLLAIKEQIRERLHGYNGGLRGVFGGSRDPSTSEPELPKARRKGGFN
jgi:hypothetical protein